jgi:hypothetical protein
VCGAGGEQADGVLRAHRIRYAIMAVPEAAAMEVSEMLIAGG